MISVVDHKGAEIKVGTRVSYGAPEAEYEATVTAIGEPDIVEEEDEYGRERVTGMALDITVKFDDGDKTIVSASDRTVWPSGPDLEYVEIEQTFEAHDDIEVIV